MPDGFLIAGFLLLVFAPCLVALLGGSFADGSYSNGVYLDSWHLPRPSLAGPVALSAIYPEISPAEDFEIRSFPKGIAQRRLLVRDRESGVKLSIAQVRAAASELRKLAGANAAYEFALVVAASAADTQAFDEVVAIVAREFLEASQNAGQWTAWGEALTEANSDAKRVWQEAPARAEQAGRESKPWREATQAA